MRAPLLELQGLRRLERGWDRLARETSPVYHYAWTEAFAETFWEIGSVVVVTVGDEHDPRALAALVRPHSSSGSLEALGVRQLFEPMDVLYEDQDALEALALALWRRGDALHLPRIPAESPFPAALAAVCRARGLVRVARTDGYPVLELDEAWKEPERMLNAGRRSDFRRIRRRAERTGPVTLEFGAPSPDELPPLLDEAWAIEAAGWKGERGSALACDALRGNFFRRFASAASRKGMLRLAFMRIGGRAVAMQLMAESAGRLWLFKIGYDEIYAPCSPGQQLMLYVIGEAARRGLRTIEFLGEEEPWTRFWTRAARPCVAVRAYPWTANGVVTLADNALKYARRKIGAQVPG